MILILRLSRKTFELVSEYNLINLVKQKTYFKNPENPSCTGILTKSSQNFQNSSVFETRLSDFYKLTTTFMKQSCTKLQPKDVN